MPYFEVLSPKLERSSTSPLRAAELRQGEMRSVGVNVSCEVSPRDFLPA
jgi:hypothetical protein